MTCSSSTSVPQKSFGMQEQHRLAVRADLRLAVAEHARAGGLQLVARGEDVVDLVADMMHAAGRVLLEEGGDRRALAERLQQLDLGVAAVDEHDRDAMLRQRLRRATPSAPSVSR